MSKTKKTVRVQILERLEKSFADLKDQLGKTKFRRNIKKAARALADNLKEVKIEPKKKPGKKVKKTVKKLTETATAG